jgi:hypothetical protein
VGDESIKITGLDCFFIKIVRKWQGINNLKVIDIVVLSKSTSNKEGQYKR